ncbi:ABC transporter substrate-binding protein [Paenibacillus larvae]|uniref:Cobalamin-binding protein n=2 Tax=Paenibacillus larvae TaxID=1464 RepID=A0A1V0UVB4_9BACL|nr:ABC transporter substrate-binding protein [Paenibacillus larvae]AQT85565.1 cobalamin-binding protein [Paenibacillus larvae subsp. pulvifaciens]AQZ47577.1 cobalamin-binding protein [Paenibacillus larvae subsp. pulvifaciens]ARF68890.1 cobalamin-binding protein [Paenibacillus larvae subsp. pulvifaciens]AVF24939.1 putative ABC transporter substrate-binding lipoprotein YvrC [Paenibacillus larvae subsp. larvae]AVF29702.1 putative ABC transporter substrate-binding lipoprotein YvrC [Paenibacillus l
MKTRWMNRVVAGVLTLALAVSMTACGKKEEPAASSSPKAEATAKSGDSSSKKTQYPLKVTDATGKEFTFEKAPERIASISPAETESLFAIGLGDKIQGVSDFDDFPKEAKSKPKLGSIMKPNVEAMIAANVDVVFTGISTSKEDVEKLRESNVQVFKVEPKTLDDVMNNMLLYGKITDHQEQAEQVVEKMKAEKQKVVDAVSKVKAEEKKKVYVEFSPGWSVGSGEFMNEIIELAGGINVASDMKGWHQISEEKIIEKNPDVILYANGVTDDKTKKNLEELIRGRSGWDQINAVKNNKVIGVDQNLISRPGPRITQGLTEVAKAIYPDLVK